MARKRLHRRLLSSDDGVPPEPSTSQPSYLVDSVIQKMLSTASFPALSSQVPLPTGSKPLMASYKQADLESNRGLKGKSRAVSAHTSCSDPIPRKDKHSKLMSLSFSISRIVFLPCGTMEPDDYGSMDDSGPSLAHLFPVIRSLKAPSTADISRLEALGLAHCGYCAVTVMAAFTAARGRRFIVGISYSRSAVMSVARMGWEQKLAARIGVSNFKGLFWARNKKVTGGDFGLGT
ncbi:hypothetical protein EDD15DRAFT_2357981 [Pisolithus albus]|nr:hypothetical protein EDD15DRAFT_2357981 [Pisolithus albus]